MLNKIADAFRLYKFGIFKIYLNKLLPEHLQFQHFLLYRKDLNNLDVYEPENNISFKRVNEVDDPLFLKFQERFPAAEFEKRIQQPDKTCYVAFQNDDVAGYGWAAKQELYLDNVKYSFKLNEDEIFIYACFILKDYRGLGIYPAMLNKMLRDSKDLGFKKAFIGVSSANNGSIRGIEKAGFEFYKRMSYIKLGSLEKWKGFDNSENPRKEMLADL